MVDKIKNIGIIVLIILGIYLGFKLFKKETEIIKVPLVIEVPIPGIQNSFPPIILPTPKTEKPRPVLIDNFIKADSITKDSLYAEAVKERLYEEIFSDSTQSITVKSKVQGKLLKQSLDYNIFPRTITVDTIIDVQAPKRLEMYGLMEVGSSTVNLDPVLKGGILLKTKKDKIISLSIDTQKRVYIGYGFKF